MGLFALLAFTCQGNPRQSPPKSPSVTDTGASQTTTTSASELDGENTSDAALSRLTLQIRTTEHVDAEGNRGFAQWQGSTRFGGDYNLNYTLLSTRAHDTRGVSVLEDGPIILVYIGSDT